MYSTHMYMHMQPMAVLSLLIYQVLKFLRVDRQTQIEESGELEDIV